MYVVIGIIFFINVLVMISIVFIEKKNPTSALAWIIILNFLPILGFILYLFLGSSEKLKLTRKRYKLDVVEEDIIKEIKKNQKFKDEKNIDSLFKMNDVNYLNTVTKDNDIVLFNDMNEAIKSAFKDILNAKESIHVSFFIFNTRSDVGKKFINILNEKAKEGVKVRLTYDRLACIYTRFSDFSELISNGGEVYKHLPNIVRSIFQSNYRNHRKMIIIDSKIAYTGGMNISDEYLGLKEKIKPWRDTFARIEGSSVMFIQSKFFIDFIYLKKLTLKRKYDEKITKKEIKDIFYSIKGIGKNIVQFVYNGPDTEYSYIRDGYLKMINDAKKSIYLQTPYFIPDESILDALRISSLSGIDVKIMIPGIPDKKTVYYVTLSFVERLIEYGIEVYVYNGFIHSKALITDDEYLSIGTCNFDARSFRLNYENNIFVKGKITKKAVDDFKNDVKNSKQMTKEDVNNFSKLKKFIGLICRLFSPLL